MSLYGINLLNEMLKRLGYRLKWKGLACWCHIRTGALAEWVWFCVTFICDITVETIRTYLYRPALTFRLNNCIDQNNSISFHFLVLFRLKHPFNYVIFTILGTIEDYMGSVKDVVFILDFFLGLALKHATSNISIYNLSFSFIWMLLPE